MGIEALRTPSQTEGFGTVASIVDGDAVSESTETAAPEGAELRESMLEAVRNATKSGAAATPTDGASSEPEAAPAKGAPSSLSEEAASTAAAANAATPETPAAPSAPTESRLRKLLASKEETQSAKERAEAQAQ